MLHFSTISKYTSAALSRAKNNVDSDKELSLLERVLALEGDTKVASILALDLFLVGVDTVNIFLILQLSTFTHINFQRMELFVDLDYSGFGAVSISVTSRKTGISI